MKHRPRKGLPKWIATRSAVKAKTKPPRPSYRPPLSAVVAAGGLRADMVRVTTLQPPCPSADLLPCTSLYKESDMKQSLAPRSGANMSAGSTWLSGATTAVDSALPGDGPPVEACRADQSQIRTPDADDKPPSEPWKISFISVVGAFLLPELVYKSMAMTGKEYADRVRARLQRCSGGRGALMAMNERMRQAA